MIFLAAVASTQAALFVMARHTERQTELLGQIYLDGLSAAVLPYARIGDAAAVEDALRRALSFHDGIVERQVGFVDSRQTVTTLARNDSAPLQPLPEAVMVQPAGVLRSDDESVWFWRALRLGDQSYGTVAAHLDVSGFRGDRERLRWFLLFADLVFSGLCAIAGFFMMRRIQQPVTVIAQRLYQAALGTPKPIETGAMPDEEQSRIMFHAFNAMVHASREREGLLAHMAEQQRKADLGQLAAVIAHEVRNPLAGMRTAISTLRRFGDRTSTREETLGFLDRGVDALGRVVDATLASYRPQADWRPLTLRDFDDLRLLVEADSRARKVKLVFDVALPDTLPVPALEVRQVLLNLLLNAIRATPQGGRVGLSARIEQASLLLAVFDTGEGMPSSLARAYEKGPEELEGPGLGIGIVIRLVERLNGRIAIDASPQTGTTVTLTLPLGAEEPSS
ncbi:HAMP domain-containing sensor histidine kinase [Bosea sp. TWI1241]|uniref:sensor histidine kinase n=1 Tax=Bosea sp. TWI1241 TaxID=3148904 RepID=UPI0032097493